MVASKPPSSDSEQPPSSGPEASDVHAAIDIGTNSFHMIVARPLPDGGFDVLTTEKDVVRLGQGAGEMKQLQADAIDRGVASLRRMAAVAASYDATVAAVATSAVREALNRNVFLRRARDESGIDVEVISGFEEARLIHLGVLQALPVFDRAILVVDIGGGSTEFVTGVGSNVKAARSLKLGAIRLHDRFFAELSDDDFMPNGSRPVAKPVRKAMKACRNQVRSALAATAHEFAEFGHEMAIGSSGTITAIASMIAAERGEAFDQANGLTFTAEELAAVVQRLAATPPSKRLAIAGLDEKRNDIILAGAVLLETIFESFGVEAMTLSAYALREGLLFDRFAQLDLDSDMRLANLRRSNALRLATALDPDAEHAETTARLALELFDQTRDRHRLGRAERELLDLGSIVHNVGLSISHAAHHKHSYYVVRNSEQLTGFSEHEVEMMALLVRYHRKGHPSAKHPEFAALSEPDQQRVRVLAGLMRVAIGLDRSHNRVVESVVVPPADGGDGGEALVVEVTAADGADIGLEVYAAQERSSLLAEALGVDVVVTEGLPSN